MRALICLLSITLVGCSTVETRRADPPIFQQTTQRSVEEFQGCFGERTAKQDVQFMPRTHGGTFTSGFYASGMPRYVLWVVDVDDLGSERKVTIHAVDSIRGPNREIIADVQACM